MVTGTTKTKLIKEEELYVSYLSQPESWRYDTAIINPADIHTLQNNLTTAELVTVNSDSKDIDISTSNITEAADPIATQGKDVFKGTKGADTFAGLGGDDTYYVNHVGDVVIENANGGRFDKVNASVNYKLAENVEWLNLTGSKAINGTGNGANNILEGNGAANILDGGAGDDYLSGNGGKDVLIGGAGDDDLFGGSGQDTFVFGRGDGLDIIYEIHDGKYINTIQYALDIRPEDIIVGVDDTHTFPSQILDGPTTYLQIKGTEDKVYLRNWYAGHYDGRHLASDEFFFSSSTQYAYTSKTIEYKWEVKFADGTVWNTEDLLARSSNVTSSNDYITGTLGNDVLSGGAGNDHFYGRAGDDTYKFGRGDGQDTILDIDTTSSKKDAILLSADIRPEDVKVGRYISDVYDYTLPPGEQLVLELAGTNDSIIIEQYFYEPDYKNGIWVPNNKPNIGAVEQIKFADGTVWDLQTILDKTNSGTSYNDLLAGTTGANTLSGGLGNDYYIVNNINDVVVENSNAGNDNVESIISYTLTANVENLTLGGTGKINGTGNDLDNSISGNDNNNTLIGGAGNDGLYGDGGADKLIGGTGDDTYDVDNKGDVVVENQNEGIDTVKSSVSYTLAQNIENLKLRGEGTTGTGNSLDNVFSLDEYYSHIINVTFNGGGGNDTFLLNSHNSGSYGNTLNAQDGNDTFIFGYDAANNIVNAGNGNDVIDLGYRSKNNKLSGGLGDDVYIIHTGDDTITEKLGEGNDTVQSSVNYTLGANLENLILSAYANNGTGNEINNTITGNSGYNTLDGGAGADILIGGAGSDTLKGGLGSDTYVFKPLDGTANGGLGVDTIVSGGFVSNLDGLFQAEEDILDLRGLFVDAAGNEGIVNVGNIDQYLRINGSTLQIDRDGGANSFTNLVNLTGTNVTSANLDELYTAGQIIA
jgi:Ca2+-binding RTX toxin-like protein